MSAMFLAPRRAFAITKYTAPSRMATAGLHQAMLDRRPRVGQQTKRSAPPMMAQAGWQLYAQLTNVSFYAPTSNARIAGAQGRITM
ncbi:hypothetical protein ACM66B_006007 [Microbotryomycetes sp. NB124-2]